MTKVESRSTGATVFESPAPFDGTIPAAHVVSGRRVLTWTVNRPDSATIARNVFVWLWCSLSEDRPMAGEATRFTVERRITCNAQRSYLTAAARQELDETMSAAVARYGFDRLWNELSAAQAATGRHRELADRSRRRAAWWDEAADLTDLWAASRLDFKPVDQDPTGRPHRGVRVPGERGSSTETPMAHAYLDGERVGWLLPQAGVVPTDYPQ